MPTFCLSQCRANVSPFSETPSHAVSRKHATTIHRPTRAPLCERTLAYVAKSNRHTCMHANTLTLSDDSLFLPLLRSAALLTRAIHPHGSASASCGPWSKSAAQLQFGKPRTRMWCGERLPASVVLPHLIRRVSPRSVGNGQYGHRHLAVRSLQPPSGTGLSGAGRHPREVCSLFLFGVTLPCRLCDSPPADLACTTPTRTRLKHA